MLHSVHLDVELSRHVKNVPQDKRFDSSNFKIMRVFMQIEKFLSFKLRIHLNDDTASNFVQIFWT